MIKSKQTGKQFSLCKITGLQKFLLAKSHLYLLQTVQFCGEISSICNRIKTENTRKS